MAGKSKRVAGVKKLAIAPLTYNNSTGVPEWGDVVEIPQFVSVSSSEEQETLQWYSNDGVEFMASNTSSVEIEIELGYLTNALRAMLTGATLDSKGVLIKKSDDVAPEYAVITQKTLLGNESGVLDEVYYRVKFSIPDSEATTKTDSIEDSPITIVGTAVALSDGRIMASIDSTDVGVDTTVLNQWFSSVYTTSA